MVESAHTSHMGEGKYGRKPHWVEAYYFCYKKEHSETELTIAKPSKQQAANNMLTN